MSRRPPQPGLPGPIFTHARTFCHTYTHIHFRSHVLDEITLTMSLTRHGCLSLDEDDDDDDYDPTPSLPRAGYDRDHLLPLRPTMSDVCTSTTLLLSYPYCQHPIPINHRSTGPRPSHTPLYHRTG